MSGVAGQCGRGEQLGEGVAVAGRATEREIRKLDEALDFEMIPSRLRTVEDVIEQLCSRYEGKFRRGRYAALRRFIRILTGAGRVVESVTSSRFHRRQPRPAPGRHLNCTPEPRRRKLSGGYR
jgi:hypothetical protein